jgi:hypothetical protein
MCEVLDEDVRAREDDALPPVVPADAVRRAVGPEYLEDLGVPFGLTLEMGAHHEPVADRDPRGGLSCRCHRTLLVAWFSASMVAGTGIGGIRGSHRTPPDNYGAATVGFPTDVERTHGCPLCGRG